MDMAWADHLKQTHPAVRATIPTLFYSAPGCLRDSMCINHFVNHYCPRFNLLREALGARNISAPNAGGESVNTVVGQLNGFFIGSKSHYWQQRPKSFISHHFHRVIDVCHHRGLMKPARTLSIAIATDKYLCAFLLCVFDMVLNDT